MNTYTESELRIISRGVLSVSLARMNAISISIVENTSQIDPWRKRLHDLLYTLNMRTLRRIDKGIKDKKDIFYFVASTIASPEEVADNLPDDILLLLCRKINPNMDTSVPHLLKAMFISYICDQK